MRKFIIGQALCVTALLLAPSPATGAERLCDPAHEDCRAILLELIRAENTAIDVAFWFMEDARYSNELVKKARAGAQVRVLVDPRANLSSPLNSQLLAQLSGAGIPMRKRSRVASCTGASACEHAGVSVLSEGFVGIAIKPALARLR